MSIEQYDAALEPVNAPPMRAAPPPPAKLITCEIGYVIRTHDQVHMCLGRYHKSQLTVDLVCQAAEAREYGRALIAQADALDGGAS